LEYPYFPYFRLYTITFKNSILKSINQDFNLSLDKIAQTANTAAGCSIFAKISETLRNVACSHIDQNLWLFDFADDITDDINAAFGTDIGKKMMTLENIKKNLGATKTS
jgi:hypothetical protein